MTTSKVYDLAVWAIIISACAALMCLIGGAWHIAAIAGVVTAVATSVFIGLFIVESLERWKRRRDDS